jgi:hypothetical protein
LATLFSSCLSEDMNSEYGKPYNTEIRHLKPVEIKSATIANSEIWIRFNVKNVTLNALFLNNIYVKLVSKHDIDDKTMFYNAWLPKVTEQKHEIKLNNYAQTYPLATFLEINSQESKHFSLIVKGEETAKNKIFKFRVYMSCNNGQGNCYTIQSDKDYLVGFLAGL